MGHVDVELDPTTRLHLKKELEQLHAEFDDLYPPERIDEVMASSIELMRSRSRVETYLPALAGRLTRERLHALARTEGRIARDAPEVLFVSLYDMGRAQIAAALMRELCAGRVNVQSAASGREISEVDPNVRVAMAEIGIDLETAYSKPLTDEVLQAADVIVTMGRSVGMVEIPVGADYRDWRIGDPGEAPLDEVRRIRDDVASRVRALLAEIAPAEPAGSLADR
jgi:protein-tyrosine-phosphatase